MSKRAILITLAVLIQLAILALVPAGKILARLYGKTVLLRTAPVDPYDIMSGYHTTLGYEISTPGLTPNRRDWNRNTKPDWYYFSEGTTVYVVLSLDANNVAAIKSWSKIKPVQLPQGTIFIKGTKRYSRIEYGIESFYIPEKKRHTINNQLWDNKSRPLAEVKIDSNGNAALTKLIIGKNIYEY